MKETGFEYINAIYSTRLQGKTLESQKGKGGNTPSGRASIFNRYALFTYKGTDTIDTSSNTEIEALQYAQSTQEKTNIADNPTVPHIINYYKKGKTNAAEYDWADFLYCKYYKKISNNYLVTLRRFPYAVEDNIFNSVIAPNPDIARCVTYFGEGTGNNLNDILGFKAGYNYRQLKSEIQVMSSQRWTNPLGGTLGKITDAVAIAADGSSKSKTNATVRTGTSEYDPVEMDGYYHNKILGPVNVIDEMQVRDRGLKYEQNIKLIAEYELKAFPGIPPKEALLDLLANILTIGYSNAPFWGGAIRYKTDYRQSYFLGDRSKLMQGDYKGYIGTVANDLTGKMKKLFGDNKGDFSFSSILTGFLQGGDNLLHKLIGNKLASSNAIPNFQVANALLTGEPTGEWHITVGNPLRPIALIGNLVLEDMTIDFDETLGNDDFPVGIKVEFNLKPARPRDKSDIENMFNLGQGRMYYVPANEEDVLNIAGKEQYHYGVVNGKDEKNKGKYDNVNLKDQISEKEMNPIKRFNNEKNIQTSLNFHSISDHVTINPKEK